MQKSFGAIIIFCLLMSFSKASYAAPPTVDGFVGVPWGASRQQVASVMVEKGYALLQQREDGVLDRYQGTFADYPAELVFLYTKNVFYYGSAELLPARDKGMDVAMKYYYEMAQLLTAKYGEPAKKSYGFLPGPGGKETILSRHSSWENIPAAITPPGQVTISVLGGDMAGYRVEVNYTIGKAWAQLKNVKDI
jgi:hypothetical protein